MPGNVSAIVAPVTSLRPLFVTTIVYVTVSPGIAVAWPSVLVIERSASGVSVSVSVALSLPELGSMALETVAVLANDPVALESIVPVTV